MRWSFSPRTIPCETRYAGLSELYGSWNTIGTAALYASRLAVGHAAG